MKPGTLSATAAKVAPSDEYYWNKVLTRATNSQTEWIWINQSSEKFDSVWPTLRCLSAGFASWLQLLELLYFSCSFLPFVNSRTFQVSTSARLWLPATLPSVIYMSIRLTGDQPVQNPDVVYSHGDLRTAKLVKFSHLCTFLFFTFVCLRVFCVFFFSLLWFPASCGLIQQTNKSVQSVTSTIQHDTHQAAHNEVQTTRDTRLKFSKSTIRAGSK